MCERKEVIDADLFRFQIDGSAEDLYASVEAYMRYYVAWRTLLPLKRDTRIHKRGRA